MIRLTRSAMAAAAAALLVSPAAAEAALVLRSAGPSAPAYPPGRSLAESAPIVLKPGDVVTVLVSNTTKVLRGPGAFRLGAAVRALAGGFNARGRFGAMRAGEIPSSPSLWHIDVSQSGTVCVAPDTPLKLWRPEAVEPVTLTIGAPGGASDTLEWGSGADELAWPARVAVGEGGEYRLTWTGNDDPTRLTFAKLPALPVDAAGLAQALIDKGCQSQLDLFIDNMPSE